MRYNRASPKDAQSEIRTKVSDSVYTRLADMADAEGVSLYEMTRRLLLSALAEQEPPCGGNPKSEPEGADFGKVRGQKAADNSTTPPSP
jgi:hypothetical protein